MLRKKRNNIWKGKEGKKYLKYERSGEREYKWEVGRFKKEGREEI